MYLQSFDRGLAFGSLGPKAVLHRPFHIAALRLNDLSIQIFKDGVNVDSIQSIHDKQPNRTICVLQNGHIAWLHQNSIEIYPTESKLSSIDMIDMTELRDGRIAIGCKEATIIIWDYRNKREITMQAPEKESYIFKIIELPNGLLLSRSGRYAHIWNTETLHVQKLIETDNWMQDMVLLRENRFALCSIEYSIYVWNNDDIQNKPMIKPRFILKGHKNWVMKLLVLHDGRLVSASDDNIRIWSLASPSNFMFASMVLDTVPEACDMFYQRFDGDLVGWNENKPIKKYDLYRWNYQNNGLFERRKTVSFSQNILGICILPNDTFFVNERIYDWNQKQTGSLEYFDCHPTIFSTKGDFRELCVCLFDYLSLYLIKDVQTVVAEYI